MSRDRGRPADNEWCARFVDQDGIDFIDNCIAVPALDLLVARRGHAIITEVIETELAVRAISDVARVLFAAFARLLIVLNTADRQPEKCIKLSHPLRVAPRQIIVYCDQ